MKSVVTLLVALWLPISAMAEERRIILSGLPVWDSAPLLLLQETQPLLADGLRFEFQPWRAPEELGAKIARQDVHVVSAPSMLAPIFARRGLPISISGTSSPAGNIKIVSRDAPGEIAVPFKGGLPDLILRSFSKGTEWEVPPIRYTATPVEAMQLLLTGQVSAAFLAEPMATIVKERADMPLKFVDACDVWKAAHTLGHCPTTGSYLSVGLSASEKEAINSAISTAYGALAADSAKAAMLLQQQFTTLADAPLAAAFAGVQPAYQDGCDTGNFKNTLRILQDYAPFEKRDVIQLLEPC